MPPIVVSFAGDVENEWNRFRGPNGSGVAERLSVPNDVSKNDIRWSIDLDAGTSSPVIVGNKLFVSSIVDKERVLHCIDAASGELIWKQSVASTRTEAATAPNGAATCSPVCNDRFVSVLFPDATLVTYTLDGELVWSRDYGPFYSMHGISASPVLVDNKLIVTIDQLQESFIAALDISSGKELWRTDRLIGVTGGYSTPVVMQLDGEALIVSAAPGEMVAYDAATGDKCMSVPGVANAPICVPTIVGNRIYYSEPQGEPIPMEALGPADKNKDGVIELEEVKNSVGTYRLIERVDKGFGNGDGKVDAAEWDKAFGTFLNRGGLSCVEVAKKDGAFEGRVVWKYTKSTPYIPSTLVLGDRVFAVNDGGILLCFNADTGAVIARERLGKATGQYYASPVASGNRIVLANLEGKVSLLQASPTIQVLSTMDLEDMIAATPSISDGRLYIRTASKLYCFGK